MGVQEQINQYVKKEKQTREETSAVGTSSVPSTVKKFFCPLILTVMSGVHVVAAALPPLPMEGDTLLKHYMYFGKHFSPQGEDTYVN